MQRLGGPWLPHVPPLRTPSSTQFRAQYSKRMRRPVRLSERKAPLRDNFLTFEASSLILDLDAENNKYVRPYDPQVDGVPTTSLLYGQRKSSSVERRIEQFEKQSQEYKELSEATAADKFSTWRISNYDILSYALDPPAQFIDPQDTSVGMVFRMNGIPYNVQDNSSKVVRYMLHRQRKARQVPLGIDDAKSLEDVLIDFQKCKFGNPDFTKIQRLITGIIQTPEGSQIVSQCTGKLAHICADVTRTTTPANMLSFLNNLIMNLESQDLSISTALLFRAFITSVRCYAFTTAQKYLKMIRDNSSWVQSAQAVEILRLLERSVAPSEPERAVYRNESDTTHQLLAIYGLLVGRIWQGATQPSLLNHMPKRDDQFFNTYLKLYITCLARLGAFRTMWHVWHMEPRNSTSSEDEDKSKASIFSMAIKEAFRTNSRLAELAQSDRFALGSGVYENDCQLDIGTIAMSANVLSTHDEDQYQAHPTDWRGIGEIFREKDIRVAMPALQRFLRQIPTGNVKNERIPPPLEVDDADSEHDRPN
ncbi:hypothetical protein GGS26DRAFT_574185 [Hypomontagnella submonticulosa]|nr:hypothetical protein GGS26DRAFT_574185 [Hypomontagnella submonticulosa]